jgi:hypothetical protein
MGIKTYLNFLQGNQPLVAVANCLVDYTKLPPPDPFVNLEIGNAATNTMQSRWTDVR